MYTKFILLLLSICGALSASVPAQQQPIQTSDLATAETSAKLLNLGGLFGQTGGGGYYPNYNYGSNGYYNRPNTGYYPSYPNYGYGNSGYYPQTGYGGSSGYYPGTGSYYPTTNILGSQGFGHGYGGYGGYGGNGGLRQYSGYWQPDYNGQRNRGYGYYENTDRWGLPKSRGGNYYGEGRDSAAYGSYGYRGYD